MLLSAQELIRIKHGCHLLTGVLPVAERPCDSGAPFVPGANEIQRLETRGIPELIIDRGFSYESGSDARSCSQGLTELGGLDDARRDVHGDARDVIALQFKFRQCEAHCGR
jgi:hypothetical protein